MSVVSKLSCLFNSKVPKVRQQVEGISGVCSLPPPLLLSQPGSSGEFCTEFPKTLRCNSVSQTEPPTADTLLTSAIPPSDTHPGSIPSSIRERTAKFSSRFPRERDASSPHGVWGRFRRYFLGSKLLESRHKFHWRLGEGDVAHVVPGFTHPGP